MVSDVPPIHKTHLGYKVAVEEIEPGKWQATCQADGKKSLLYPDAESAFAELQRYIDVQMVRR